MIYFASFYGAIMMECDKMINKRKRLKAERGT